MNKCECGGSLFLIHNPNHLNMILVRCKKCDDLIFILQYNNVDIKDIEWYKSRHPEIYGGMK